MKKNNVLKIVLLTFVLAGVVGAAAALTKGFKEIPEFVLNETETIEHHEEHQEQQQEHEEQIHFTKDDIVEITGEILLQDDRREYPVKTKSLEREDSDNGDILLKYETVAHDIDNGDPDNLYSIIDYRWGAKISYILSDGRVSNEYYGCNNQHKPNKEFPRSCLNGYYTYLYFSLNGIEPNNGTYKCDEIKTKDTGKIFVMSSANDENPDLYSSYGDLTVNGSSVNLQSSEDYPNRPEFFALFNDDEGQLLNLEFTITERTCNDKFNEFIINKDSTNHDLKIDNTNKEYNKFYVLLSNKEQQSNYLDELVKKFDINKDKYNTSLYIYGKLNDEPVEPIDPPVISNPSDIGIYKLTINNSDLINYFDEYNEINVLSNVRHKENNKWITESIYFYIENIKTYNNGELVNNINNFDSPSKSHLLIRLGNSYIPELSDEGDYGTTLSIGISNISDIYYEFNLVIIYFETDNNFGQIFLDNYQYFDSPLYYETIFNKFDYITIEPLISTSATYNYLRFDGGNIIQVESEEYFNPKSLSEDWYFSGLKVNNNLEMTLIYNNDDPEDDYDEPIEQEIFIGKGKIGLYLNYENPLIPFCNKTTYLNSDEVDILSLLVQRRNDLKMTTINVESYQFHFAEMDEDAHFTQIYTDRIAYARVCSDGAGQISQNSINIWGEEFGFTSAEIGVYHNNFYFEFVYEEYEVGMSLEFAAVEINEDDYLWVYPSSLGPTGETGMFLSFETCLDFRVSVKAIEREFPLLTLNYENVYAHTFETEREYVIDPYLEVSTIGRLTKDGTLTWRKRDKDTLELLDEKTDLDSFEVVGNDNPKHIQCKKNGSYVVPETLVNFDTYKYADYYITIEFNSSYDQSGYYQNIVYSSILGYIE